jgi:hypothetical protein
MDYEVEIPNDFNLEEFLNRASLRGDLPSGTELRKITAPNRSAKDAEMGFIDVIQVLNANPVFFGLLLTAIVDFAVRSLRDHITIRYKDSDGKEKVLVGSAEEIKKAISEM